MRLHGVRKRSRKFWAVLAAVAAVVVLVVLLPWRPGPPVLELVALDDQGQFGATAAIPAGWAERTRTERGSVARVPLLLGVYNSGGREARPERLDLSLPRQFQLKLPDGRPLPVYDTPGSPLVRYQIDLRFAGVQPGRVPELLPGVDTLWLELATPSIYCVLLPDSVPEFVPAPEPHVQALSRLQVFYSFAGGDIEGRQAGLLSLNLDPEILEHQTLETPPSFPSEVIRPSAPMPPMSGLRYGGSRHSLCGAPEEPVEILSILWETLDGGDFYVIDHGGHARKYLFDLNGDGNIELEMWDSDGSGRFNTRRRAQFPVPEFLRPVRQDPDDYRVPRLAELSPDSLERLDRFHAARTAEQRGRIAMRPGRPREERYHPLALGPRPDPRPAPPQPPRLLGTPVDEAPRVPAQPAPEPAEAAPVPPPEEPEPDPDPTEQRRPPRLLGEPVDTLSAQPRRR